MDCAMAAIKRVEESKNLLLVEFTGGITLIAIVLVALIHGLVLRGVLRELWFYSHQFMAVSIGLFSAFTYCLLFYLALVPFRETVTYVFDAVKCEITITRRILGKWSMDTKIPFKEFTQFELAPPEGGGFLRLRLANGDTRLLFRLADGEHFPVLKRLDDITRKKLAVVDEKNTR